MHERTVQLAALSVSLLAHGALIAAFPESALQPGGPIPQTVIVTLKAALPAVSVPGRAPDPVSVSPAAPPVAPAPQPAMSRPTEPPVAIPVRPESLVATRPPDHSHGMAPARPPAVPESPPAPAVPVRDLASPGAAAATPTANRTTPPPAQHAVPQRYLGELLAHIERNKYYPRAARRRHVEGRVRVAFMLLDDGRIMDIKVDSGPGLLRSAARHTLERAVPMPRPPDDVDCPLAVRYEMRYRLN